VCVSSSCRVLCGVVLVVCLCVTCFSYPNQVVGPPLFKMAIKLVREDNYGYDPKEAPKTGLGPRIRNLGNVKVAQLGRPKVGVRVESKNDHQRE